ncbi:MAG: sigma-70 family RNA polymerase sigma factor [Acidobacteria bacterium]|nr:sigma-70 family RNA polymerase sigma factor [Acidobacteriota bacterium]
MPNNAGEVTLLLAQMKEGDQDALARLMPLVYRELRRLAGHFMRQERPDHTLQATALVHEAFLRLVGQDPAGWQCRTQFMSVAALLMRRVLVDNARRRATAKREAGVQVTLDDARLNQGANIGKAEEILAVDEALARLSQFDAQQARVVELRYFGGLSVEETAEAMEISPRTVKRDWAVAKAWLATELASEASG